MAKVIRRRYLGGTVAALSGLLAAACGEVEIRYVQGPAGPAGQAGARGATGATGASGAAGAAGGTGKTIVVEKPLVVEKIVERPVVVEKIVEKPVERIVEKIVEVPAPPPQREPVTLDFQHRWNGPAREPIVQQAIDMFMEKHEHIKVNLTMNKEDGPGTDGGVPIAKILVAIAAGTPPDVFMIHADAAIEFARRNALTWLDIFLARDKRSLQELYFPAVMAYIQDRGQTFALSQTASGDSPYFFYNKGLLAGGGATPDQLGTWQGLLEAAKTLTKQQGDTFAQIGFPYPGGFTTWHTINGGKFWTEDGRKVLFDDEIGRETLTFKTEAVKQVYGSWQKLNAFYEDHKGSYSKARPQESALFDQGRLAILSSGPWQWINLPEHAPDIEFGALRLPRNANNPQSKQTTLAGSVWTWSMGAGLEHPDEAWLLQRWMSQDDGHRHLMTTMGRATMYRPVVTDPIYYQNNPGWDLVLETINAATPLPISKGGRKAMGIISAVTTEVLEGKLGVASALEQAAEKAQIELDKAYAQAES